MIRFPGLDGLRGWLAWTVVLHHIAFFSGLGAPWLPTNLVLEAGGLAVMIFIVLSGFVITHLIVERHEPYGLYLARRALRIYPIYLFALLLGVATTFLTFRTFLAPDGTLDAAAMAIIRYPQVDNFLVDHAMLQGNAFYTHLVLHLTMMHGLFAGNFVPDAEFMFLSPAWSLSLEWQFYLVAPAVIWAARRKIPALVLAAASLFLFYLYGHQFFGWWALPSFLPGAGLYFAVGIACRLLMTPERSRFSWIIVAILALGFVLLEGWRLPVEVWLVFLAASLYRDRAGRFSKPVGRVVGALFESPLARHLGEASYSTYLLHFPLLQLAMYVAVRGLALTPMAATVFVTLATLLSTYALSQLTWRVIERPFIALGKRLGSKDSSSETAVAGTV